MVEEKNGKEKNCLASDNRERGHKCCSKFCICSSKNGDMTFTSRLAAISRVRKCTRITAAGLGGEYLHTFYSCWDLGAYPCINLYFLSWNCVVNYDNCCSKYLMCASWIDTTYFNYIHTGFGLVSAWQKPESCLNPSMIGYIPKRREYFKFLKKPESEKGFQMVCAQIVLSQQRQAVIEFLGEKVVQKQT